MSSSPVRRKKERFCKWRAILFKTAEAMLQDNGVKVFVMVYRLNISYMYNSELLQGWIPVEEIDVSYIEICTGLGWTNLRIVLTIIPVEAGTRVGRGRKDL